MTNPGADAFLFVGQGSQYAGMGADLLVEQPGLRDLLDRADAVLGVPLSRIMLEGPDETLTLTENTQPAILTLSLIHYSLALRSGRTPCVLLGHSLGEFSAWVAAGSLAFEDALRLVRLRGQAMQEAVPVGQGAMAAVISADLEEVEALCAEVAAETGQVVAVSVINCPGNTVVSGHAEAVALVEGRIRASGRGTTIPLKVSAPFHCGLLKPAAEALEAALALVSVEPSRLPVIPNVTGEVAPAGLDGDAVRRLLVRQVVEPVRWEASLRAAISAGATRAVSMGPGSALRSHLKRVSRRFPVLVLDEAEDRRSWGLDG